LRKGVVRRRAHPRLTVEGEVVRKGGGGEDGYSGFSVGDPTRELVSPTPLEGILRAAGAATVVIVGPGTDYCVKEAALDALGRGFHTTVLTAAVRAVNLEPGDGDRALAAPAEAGASVR
jgi:nicotinamidase/pyrazinamidase